MVITDARIRDKQIHRARFCNRAFDRAAIRDVRLHPSATDLLRDPHYLLPAARADSDLSPIAGQRPPDARTDAAAAARD